MTAKEAGQERLDTMPEQLEKPDMERFADAVRMAVNHVAVHGRAEKDVDHYLFEAALEAVYGPDIWKWWNQHAGDDR